MKVAIIGAGDVGRSSAQRIAEADLADIVLVDIVEGKAEAAALDLRSASSIIHHSRSIIGTTDYKDIAGADIVILTCGKTRTPQQSRKDLLLENAGVIEDISQKLVQYCPGSIVVVVTNPVDALTYLTFKITGFPANRIIGMGGVSDCARFNMLVAAELNAARCHIHSIIIGAHADSMVVLPRLSTVSGIPITELIPQDRIEKIIEETRHFGAKIVRLLGRGSAYLGPSAGIFALVDSIVNDRKGIFCASVYVDGQYGLKDLCIGVPAKIGKAGIEEMLQLNLTTEETRAFLASAGAIRGLIKELGD